MTTKWITIFTIGNLKIWYQSNRLKKCLLVLPGQTAVMNSGGVYSSDGLTRQKTLLNDRPDMRNLEPAVRDLTGPAWALLVKDWTSSQWEDCFSLGITLYLVVVTDKTVPSWKSQNADNFEINFDGSLKSILLTRAQILHRCPLRARDLWTFPCFPSIFFSFWNQAQKSNLFWKVCK